MADEITITVKVSTGQVHTAKIRTSDEVERVKEVLAELSGVPAAQQRLIYAGHVLKDNQTVASYNIKDGHTIHLVRGAAKTGGGAAPAPAAAAPAASAPPPAAAGAAAGGMPGFNPFGGAGFGGGAGGFAQMQQQLMQNPEMLQTMMDSPMMQQMLNNPEMLQQMMRMNPQTRQMMETNPEFAQVLNNPEVMRQAMEMMRNPALMQEMQRNQDRAMANIDAHPEGFNALRRMYEQVQEPLAQAAEEAAPAPNAGNPFAALFAQQPGNAAPAPATGPLPNPWGGGGGGAGGGGTAGAGAGAAQPAGAGGFPNMFGGAGGAGGLAEMLQNPMVQQMTQQMMQNPQMMENLMRGGGMPGMPGVLPVVAPVVPLAADLPIVLDPQLQARYAQVQGNPEVTAAAAALRQSFAAFRAAVTNAAPPANAPPPAAGQNAGANPFAALFANAGAGRPASPAGQAPPAPAASAADLAARYQGELAQLNEMGFHNADANIRALVATGGNVQAALEMLLR